MYIISIISIYPPVEINCGQSRGAIFEFYAHITNTVPILAGVPFYMARQYLS